MGDVKLKCQHYLSKEKISKETRTQEMYDKIRIVFQQIYMQYKKDLVIFLGVF